MDFNEKFQEITKGKFKYIKFTSFSVDNYTQTTVVNAVYDSHKIKLAELNLVRREIDEVIGNMLGGRTPNYRTRYTAGRYSFSDVKEAVLQFFHTQSMTVFASLDTGSIAVSKENDVISVTLKIPSTLFNIVDIDSYLNGLEQYLNDTGFYSYRVFTEKTEPDFEEIRASLGRERATPVYKYALEGGRTIDPKKRIRCFKSSVGGVAGYITDQHNEGNAVLYGKIGGVKQREYPDKKNPDAVKKFVTFTLDDTTGIMKCTFFDKTKEQNMCGFIENDKYIIAKGRLERDTFVNDGSLRFMVTLFDYCEETKFTVNEINRELSSDYLVVHPKKEISSRQDSLFEEENVFPFEKMVVFDLYTATESGKEKGPLIEIAAVKIVNHKITESFESFINPKSEVTFPVRKNLHLSPSDYIAGPTFDMVLPDFKLFCKDFPLATTDVRNNTEILNSFYSKLLFGREDISKITDINKVLHSQGKQSASYPRLLEKLKSIAAALGA